MSFAVKLDENLGRSHTELLRQAGYDADRVLDQGLSGAADAIVWERCCAEARFFITLDLDFADIRRYRPGSHPGILLIRSRNRSAAAVTQVLKRVIAERQLDTMHGCLAVATTPLPESAIPPQTSSNRRGLGDSRCHRSARSGSSPVPEKAVRSTVLAGHYCPTNTHPKRAFGVHIRLVWGFDRESSGLHGCSMWVVVPATISGGKLRL